MKENCGQCKYFDDDFSVCRRYPPVYIKEGERHSIISFPTVCEGEWCGEFKTKGVFWTWDYIFSRRIVNALKRADIQTLSELKKLNDKQLVGIKYIGRKSLDEIKNYLATQKAD